MVDLVGCRVVRVVRRLFLKRVDLYRHICSIIHSATA
jgi:hypothetical protein